MSMMVRGEQLLLRSSVIIFCLILFLVLIYIHAGCSRERYAEELNSKAMNLYGQGRYNDAIKVGEKALKVAEGTFGREHPSTATYLSNLAEFYYANGQYEKAVPLIEKAVKIKKLDGADHPYLALSLNLLGMVYDAQGNYANAESLYLRALAIWEKAYGKNDYLFVVPVLGKIAAVYEKQGKADAAEKIRNRIKTSTSNTDKRKELISKRNSLIRHGKYHEAEKAGEQVLVLTERIFGKDAIFVALALDELAEIYEEQNRFDKAELLYKRELEIWKKARGPDHAWVEKTLKNLVRIYKKMGNEGKMKAVEESLQRIHERK